MDQAVETRRSTVRVGKNAVALLSAQVATKLLALMLVGMIARYEGAAGLGRYVLITTVMALAAAISDLGLTTLLTRDTASRRSRLHQRLLLSHVLPLRMALAALATGLLLGAAWTPFFPSQSRGLFFVGALSLLPQAATGVLGGFVNGRRRMEISSAITVVVRLVTLAGAVPALAAGFGVTGVVACRAAAEALGVLSYVLVLRRWRLLPQPRLLPTEWRETLSDAYPFAMTGIIAMAYRRLDVVLLSAWQGDVAAGQYGAAYKLWEAVGLIPASLLDAMFPELARLAQAGNGHLRLRRILRRTGPLVVAGGFLLSGVSAALAAWLMPVVYGRAQAQQGAITAFRLQVWSVPAMFLYLLCGHTLYALDRQRWVTGAMAVVGLFNVGLNLLVIPRWSTLGVSGVAVLSAWLLAALLATLVIRALRDEEKTV